MKKQIFNVLLAIFIFFTSVIQVNAAIKSEYDIRMKKNQVQTIAGYNYSSMVNKNELIGYRLANFNMSTSQYKNAAGLVLEKLNGILAQIDVIKNSSDFSDSDKEMQLQTLYQDADTALYELDSKSITYVSTAQDTMPTITYKRFCKRFVEFYNSFKITNSTISVQ